MKQPNMVRVLYALAPLAVSGVYFFGWRALAVLGVCMLAGLLTEWITASRRGAPVSMACFVTSCLYALSLPPTIPFWIAVIGVVVGILFGKEVFGGFSRNFANPAIVGRAFVYVCFPVPLTAQFVPAFRGFPGGFAHWSFEGLRQLPAHLAAAGKSVADAVSQASPLYLNKALGPDVAATAKGGSLWEMFLGNIGGTYQSPVGPRILSAGSIGEGCALLIILGGVYLLVTKTANWRLMLSPLIGAAAAILIFRHLLGFNQWRPGSPDVAPLLFTLLGGTTLYAMVFMVTEPISAPKRHSAMLVYGALIGFLIVVLRWRGVFVAATSFSILLGNLVAPLLDMAAAAWANRKRAAAAGADRAPAGDRT